MQPAGHSVFGLVAAGRAFPVVVRVLRFFSHSAVHDFDIHARPDRVRVRLDGAQSNA